MKKAGKRTAKRQAMNRKLDQLGITRCEVRIPGKCVDSIMLTWAHSKKSRFLVSDEDWLEACRACIPCHDYIEAQSHEKMREAVVKAIGARKFRDSLEELE